MSDLKISVVIPVYNGARFIGNAINSVLCQSVRAAEIIVVNDGSRDNTLDVLQSFGDQIVVIDQTNAGVSAARNAGSTAAIGDYVAYLDADDYWPADKIEVYASAARQLNMPQFIFSNFVRENFFTKEKLPSNTTLNPWLFNHLNQEVKSLCQAQRSRCY